MPLTVEAATLAVEDAPVENSYTGSETILLVEDEEIVRTLVCEILKLQGYSVVEACDPTEALAICEVDRTFDLLLTDVIMPTMNGRELARRLAPQRPLMKVLFTSGYSDQVIVDGGELEPGTALLQKPFMLDELAFKVRELLDLPDLPAAA